MSGPTRPTHGSYTAEPSIKAFFECLSLAKKNGGRSQLENAINTGQKALLQIPAGFPSRAAVTNILALLSTNLYSQILDIETLKSAIKYSQEAVDLTPIGNPARAIYLSSLGNHLSIRYEREGDLKDLTQAIEHSQGAVDLTPTGNPDRAGRLSNLSSHLSIRYKREGDLKDLTQAIEYSQGAVDLTPTSNPDRAGYLSNLSSHLSIRYKREGDLKDLTRAIEWSENAINSLNSPPSIRVRGCLNAVSYLAQLQRWQEARILLDRGLKILPLLISNLSSKLDQENMMKSVSGLAAISYAVSLECNNDGFEAVRILELSRGTINRLAINSAAEISALSRLYLNLAKRFEDLRSIINRPVKVEDDQSRTN
ncbi:MAG: hypothetical protein Q9167_005178 [Letrouitia subvulpina]